MEGRLTCREPELPVREGCMLCDAAVVVWVELPVTGRYMLCDAVMV
jgi:hypothetical protein